MAEEVSISDLLSGGSLKGKLLALLPAVFSDDAKEKLLKELGEGKGVVEVHTKAGLKDEKLDKFAKRKCLFGQMTLPENGHWICFAVWESDGKLFQGTLRVVPDPDPARTVLSLAMASPPGTMATTFTVVDMYFKFDRDGQNLKLTISGELGVSCRDKNDVVRTIKFTTIKNKIAGL